MWVDKRNCGPVQGQHAKVIAAYVEKYLKLHSFHGVRVSSDGVVLKILFTKDDYEKDLMRAIAEMEELHNQGHENNDMLFDHRRQDCMRIPVGGGLNGPKLYEIDIVCHQPNEQGIARLRERDNPGVLAAMTAVTGFSLN